MLLLVFGGSFLVSSLSAKAYLEQQLTMKNADNATALALSLTQQHADMVLLELTLSAQFDTGFYEMIQLVDPEGNVAIYREDTQIVDDAPHYAGNRQVNADWLALSFNLAQCQINHLFVEVVRHLQAINPG